MLKNVIIKNCTTMEEFNSIFDDLIVFYKKAVEETIIQQQKENIDYNQTIVNMAYKNWETNKECFLYIIYKTKKFINDNGMCTFLYKGNSIIAASGVEILNKNVAIVSKRTFVLSKYRLNFINSYFLIPAQQKWLEGIKPLVKLILVTFNEYQKEHSFKSIKKAVYKELDGKWNIWKDWKVYSGTLNIHYTIQYVIYKILDNNIKNEKEIEILIEGEYNNEKI